MEVGRWVIRRVGYTESFAYQPGLERPDFILFTGYSLTWLCTCVFIKKKIHTHTQNQTNKTRIWKSVFVLGAVVVLSWCLVGCCTSFPPRWSCWSCDTKTLKPFMYKSNTADRICWLFYKLVRLFKRVHVRFSLLTPCGLSVCLPQACLHLFFQPPGSELVLSGRVVW